MNVEVPGEVVYSDAHTVKGHVIDPTEEAQGYLPRRRVVVWCKGNVGFDYIKNSFR